MEYSWYLVLHCKSIYPWTFQKQSVEWVFEPRSCCCLSSRQSLTWLAHDSSSPWRCWTMKMSLWLVDQTCTKAACFSWGCARSCSFVCTSLLDLLVRRVCWPSQQFLRLSWVCQQCNRRFRLSRFWFSWCLFLWNEKSRNVSIKLVMKQPYFLRRTMQSTIHS